EKALCKAICDQFGAEHAALYRRPLECVAAYPGQAGIADQDIAQLFKSDSPHVFTVPIEEEQRRSRIASAHFGMILRAIVPIRLPDIRPAVLDIRWPKDIRRSAQVLFRDDTKLR